MISRRQFLKAGLTAGAFAALPASVRALAASEERRRNVLFIAVDDLRPELGCYGVSAIRTPNLDALARRGTVFNRAYCQQAVCSPSRTSLLTGRRPDTTRIYNLQTHFRTTLPDVVTLPEHFKQHGYHTQGMGKIYHNGLDDPQSWTVPHWMPRAAQYASRDTLAAMEKRRQELRAQGVSLSAETEKDPKTGATMRITRSAPRVNGPPWEIADVPDNALGDGLTAEHAIQTLREIKDRPFFLGVGIARPHLPFVAPRKYYDLYPPEALHLADNPFPSKDAPRFAFANSGELRLYQGMPRTGPIPDAEARELIRGYYAATSYADTQIGRVLDELDRLGLRDSTAVVLWGDHGWQLGEHGEWCKHTNFEVATRSPLIVSAPGQKHAGAKTDALAEFVDIYPTLCDLCNLPLPKGLEGTSLAPVIKDPTRPWKRAAFSQYPRNRLMGHSMRTDRYRYTEWAEPGKPPEAIELYDHKTDPEENVNIANRPESKELMRQLAKQLSAGWQAALPAR